MWREGQLSRLRLKQLRCTLRVMSSQGQRYSLMTLAASSRGVVVCLWLLDPESRHKHASTLEPEGRRVLERFARVAGGKSWVVPASL